MVASAPSVRRVSIPVPSIGSLSIRLLVLLGLATLAIVAFMTFDSRGNWDFVLPFRARKLIALAVVGHAIAVSAVAFQTITNNRILTPSIMGFDALYMLIQTIAVFFLGSSSLLLIDYRLRFAFEVVAMMLFAGLLFWWLFFRGERDLHLLLLVGIIFGVMFRSVTNLLQRMIDPTEFVVLQDIGFASFNSVDQTLLTVATILVLGATLLIWHLRSSFDTMTLGKELAIGLGVDYQRVVMLGFAAVVMLVSVSTALVGPVAFLGLLVAHIAYATMGTWRHSFLIPAVSLVAVITLVGGQAVLEHVFQFNTSLAIIVEFLGGLVFLALLVKGTSQ